MKFITCDSLVGLPRIPESGYYSDLNDLLTEMARLDIQTAIVRHVAVLDGGAQLGNQVLLDEIPNNNQTIPALFVTPDGYEPDFDPAVTIANAVRNGIKICWTDPQAESFSLQPWCSGQLYRALSKHKMPLILDYAQTNMTDLHTALSEFPDLRVVIISPNRQGRNRMLYPLLKHHKNLYLCLSYSYCAFLGFEDLCKTFGHHRFVFGTGYPNAEGGTSIAGLMYADISTDAKQAIAHQNIERLLAEVQS